MSSQRMPIRNRVVVRSLSGTRISRDPLPKARLATPVGRALVVSEHESFACRFLTKSHEQTRQAEARPTSARPSHS
jgi:hypothetical protein